MYQNNWLFSKRRCKTIRRLHFYTHIFFLKYCTRILYWKNKKNGHIRGNTYIHPYIHPSIWIFLNPPHPSPISNFFNIQIFVTLKFLRPSILAFFKRYCTLNFFSLLNFFVTLSIFCNSIFFCNELGLMDVSMYK